jgi:hypothetical protein
MTNERPSNPAYPWRRLWRLGPAGDTPQLGGFFAVSGSHKLFNPTRRQALRATFARTA